MADFLQNLDVSPVSRMSTVADRGVDMVQRKAMEGVDLVRRRTQDGVAIVRRTTNTGVDIVKRTAKEVVILSISKYSVFQSTSEDLYSQCLSKKVSDVK